MSLPPDGGKSSDAASGSILEVLTRDHGRHLGLVRGSRNRALLQAGNGISLQWRARLADHLGSITLELTSARAGALMENRDALAKNQPRL